MAADRRKPLDRAPDHALYVIRRAACYLSRYGERQSIDWLIYNPLRMWEYHRFAAVDAVTVGEAVTSVFPNALTAIDVGSGTGTFAAALIRRGLVVRACERSRAGRLMSHAMRVPTVKFDLAQTPPAAISGSFDLAYCFEVAEHLPPDLGDRLVEFLCGLGAPDVVFTAAAPGQGGDGHINEQPRTYWQERFARQGYVLAVESTASLAQGLEAVEQSWWLRENIMAFARA